MSMLGIPGAFAFGIPFLLHIKSATGRSDIPLMPATVGLLLFIGVMLAFGIPMLLRNMARPNSLVMAGVLLLIGVASAFAIPFLLHNMSATIRPNILVMMLMVLVLDVAYRKLSRNGHPVNPRGGGQIYYIPVWVWAIAVFAFAYFLPNALH